jgi:polyribonucleotide nucleotidyltransferase
MDFKVAGTERGITALQMDIKIGGVTFDILRDALTRAHAARTFILSKMAEVIDRPREQLSQFAPRIQTIQIDPSQIGLLIGKGGETIRGLSEEFESQIDVSDDGQVLVYSANGELGDALVDRVRMMLKEVEVGDEYVGKVVKTTTFGAFIELTKGTDGLLHISNVSPGERVASVEDVLNKGDEVTAVAQGAMALVDPHRRRRPWSTAASAPANAEGGRTPGGPAAPAARASAAPVGPVTAAIGIEGRASNNRARGRGKGR